ncbi:MAG: hypothetical protein Q7U01_11685 [Pseudomonas sp.]|nr:hypothetical protein [Pseudomonas sp.]
MSRTILILLLALAAGNNAVAASAGSPKSPTLESAAAAYAPKPLIIPAAKGPAKTAVKVPAKPVSKSKAAPVKTSKPASSTKARQTTKAKVASSSATRTKLAPIKLNLSLPPKLVEDMELGKPVTDSAETPLLPPLFVEEKPGPSPYQLSGKLITNERQRSEQDNYLDALEGAEFSIEYRH